MAENTHRITLTFEDAETLVQALEYIGDANAPVMITGGIVVSDEVTYQLWDDYQLAQSVLSPAPDPS